MADRFPLILNTSSNQIQELPSGDTLNLSGSGLNLTGITTLSASAQLNLGGGTNINTGTRGDILYYNSSGQIAKLSLGASGKVLQSNGTDLVYGSSGTAANVYYVSTGGTDASGFGTAIDTAFKTIKYAVANIGTPSSTAPAVIFVKSGVYEEVQLPIVVPAHTTIAGDSLRATIVKPGSGLDSGGSILNTRSTLFKMSNASVLQDLVMDGMGGYTPGSPVYKPESATVGGVYLALNNASPILTKSPYIYNVTSFGNGATGAVLDGSVHASGNRSMLFHTYTAVHSDGLGIWLKNNANAELISTFTYYCTIGLAATGGSKIRSLNSSNAYGEYGVYSAGFDSGETANSGTIKGQMLVYTNVLTTSFTDGEQVTGGTSGATAYVVNVQAEPKRMYIVQRSGTFQSNETVTGGSSGATATMTSGTATVNQSGRILVTTFSTAPDAGDSLQFASTDGNAYQIQSVSSVTANSVAYKILVFSTSRATAVAADVAVHARKEFSLARLTGHDFLQVGTGGTDTTNWPNNPTQSPAQADQVVTNETDPGRVYYTATDDLGNFYVGDQFKVDQATGNVTLDASAFNLSGLESLRLGSVGGLIGAAVGEFSTDVTLSQNSDTKVSTQKAVKTYVDTLDDITPTGGTFTVAGISTVTGTTQFTKQLNVSGVSTFHNDVILLDGDKLRLGTSQDLEIYHDSNNSYIAENGGGDLKIQASAGSIIIQKDNGEEMIKATVDGSVELYHDDVVRLTTTSTGVSIGGSLTVPGNLSVGGVLTYEDVTNVDSIGIITARTSIKLDADGSASSNFLSIGADDDLKIFHQSNVDKIESSGGGLHIRQINNGDLHIHAGANTGSANNRLVARAGGKAELYYGGNLKLSTETGGVNITGVCTATSFVGNGASLTNLNGSNIASGTVPVARIGTGTKNNTTFYRGDGTFQVVSTDLVGDTSPQLGGGLASNGYNINFADSNGAQDMVKFGADGDARIYHNGSDLYIDNDTGGTWIGVDSGSTFGVGNGPAASPRSLRAVTGAQVDLYHNTSIRLTTTTTGVVLTGGDHSATGTFEVNDGSSGDCFRNLNGGSTKWCLGTTTNTGNATVSFDARSYDTSRARLHKWTSPNRDGGSYGQYSEAWYDGGTYRIITALTIGFAVDHHFLPGANNTYDLGTSSLRWRNIYTNDLNLSNEGGKNEVDGTWGNYTIQEGENDLFLINKRSGKKYKFNLTEVS